MHKLVVNLLHWPRFSHEVTCRMLGVGSCGNIVACSVLPRQTAAVALCASENYLVILPKPNIDESGCGRLFCLSKFIGAQGIVNLNILYLIFKKKKITVLIKNPIILQVPAFVLIWIFKHSRSLMFQNSKLLIFRNFCFYSLLEYFRYLCLSTSTLVTS